MSCPRANVANSGAQEQQRTLPLFRAAGHRHGQTLPPPPLSTGPGGVTGNQDLAVRSPSV